MTAYWTPARPGDTPGGLLPGEADTPPPVDLRRPKERPSWR